MSHEISPGNQGLQIREGRALLVEALLTASNFTKETFPFKLSEGIPGMVISSWEERLLVFDHTGVALYEGGSDGLPQQRIRGATYKECFENREEISAANGQIKEALEAQR